MRSRFLRAFLFLAVIAMLGTLACDLSTIGIAQASKPQIVIQSPISGAQFREGDEVTIQSVAVDQTGIVRVELAVDGATVRADAPPVPQGQTSFTLIQKWTAATGTHTLSVRAYNAANVASEPAFISINVSPAVAVLPTQPVVPSSLSLTPTIPPSGATVTSSLPTATRTPSRPPASPTISAPPGVYATSIRIDPTAPKRGQFVTFFVTFFNNTGAPQDYRWRIRIFEPDKRNSFGDTAVLSSTIPVGSNEIASEPNWRVTGPGDCIQFFARVFWVDPNSKQETEFIKLDQSGGPAAGFQVCP